MLLFFSRWELGSSWLSVATGLLGGNTLDPVNVQMGRVREAVIGRSRNLVPLYHWILSGRNEIQDGSWRVIVVG